MGGSCPAIVCLLLSHVRVRCMGLSRVSILHDVPQQQTYKTRGDLIFSASRVRFALFHACHYDMSLKPTTTCIITYRCDRGEYARLTSKLLVVRAIIPACSAFSNSTASNEPPCDIPTPNPSPFIGRRLSSRSRESNAWLMIEWHGRVSRCESWTGEVPL